MNNFEEMTISVESLKLEVAETIRLSEDYYGEQAAKTMVALTTACFRVLDVSIALLAAALDANVELKKRLESNE